MKHRWEIKYTQQGKPVYVCKICGKRLTFMEWLRQGNYDCKGRN